MKGPLDDWHQNAILVDVPVAGPLQLKQFRLACPWCDKAYLVIVDREHAQLSGYRICDHCGQFFRFWLDAPTEASATRRAIARPRPRSRLMMGNAKAPKPKYYHYQPDPATPRTLLCGTPWVAAPWNWANKEEYDGPEPTGVTDDPEQVTCPECRKALHITTRS